ncbi:hypothetical protein Vretifemale_5426 [Volvox reticuliferus]|uniref:Uncharacterized protein n=1 Tax=Volvox reticuliferus TaxID=1737510 RepID=A0A8J4FHS6_9CHLO|nr:hypothetical protein Vretifemale_5426 [Volvox reticuliferus]
MGEFYCRACYNEQPGSTAPKSTPQHTHGVDRVRSLTAAAQAQIGAPLPRTASYSSDSTRQCHAILPQPLKEPALTGEEECPGRAADWVCPACRCVRCGMACCPITVMSGGFLPVTQNAGGPAQTAAAAGRCLPASATGQHRGDVAQLAMWRVMAIRAAAQQAVTGAGTGGHGAAVAAVAAAAAAAAAPPLLLEQCRALAAAARSPVQLEHWLDMEVTPNPSRAPALNRPLEALLQTLLPSEPWNVSGREGRQKGGNVNNDFWCRCCY